MDSKEFFQEMPYARHLDIEIQEMSDGHAKGTMPLTLNKSWHSEKTVAHGGSLFSFADVVGGAAIRSVVDNPTPTIDMRIDYFNAATDDVYGHGEVVKHGKTTATIDVEILEEPTGEKVAEARGVYKVSPA